MVRQSDRLPLYRDALDRLTAMGVTYPCFCTRKTIEEEIARAAGAEAVGSGRSSVYPGTCRALETPSGRGDGRLGPLMQTGSMPGRALRLTGPLTWSDAVAGRQIVDLRRFGDVVIARKEIPTSYHLAVVVDDAAAGVTLVTRGRDLLAATHVHRTLQALLGMPEPVWHHHPLVTDGAGRRLAKRDDDTSLRALRAEGRSAEDVLALAVAAAR